MLTIQHQLKNEEFYFPYWEIDHLLIGTFNPHLGEEVKYYYGRSKNQTWKLLSNIFDIPLCPESKTFFPLLKKHKIGCVDMIDQITIPDSRKQKVTGHGYMDSEIINRSVLRKYNTQAIIDIINNNQHVKVYSTWGKGPSLREWRMEIAKLGKIIPLVSPSLAARVPKGYVKYSYMLEDWNKKIII